MNDHDEDFELQEDPIISLLIEVIQKSQPEMSILNFQRYSEILIAKKAFDDLLRKSGEARSKISFHPMFCSVSLSADVDSLEVCDLYAFHTIIEKSNNFEIIPLANGQIRISFMFNHTMRTIE